MSLIRDVLLAAHEAGVEDADVALRDLARLEQAETLTLIAADGTTIDTVLRQPGERTRWEAPEPFFAVALAAVRIEPHGAQAINLED